MARDLTWARQMDRADSWRPDIPPVYTRETPGVILEAYRHSIEGTPVPTQTEGETLQPLFGAFTDPTYIYVFDLPEEIFTTNFAPNRAQVFRVTRRNLPDVIKSFNQYRPSWDTTKGPGAASGVLQRVLSKPFGEHYSLIAKKIRSFLTNPDDPIYKSLREDSKTILEAITLGRIELPPHLDRELTGLVWKDFMEYVTGLWGGFDFAEDLFTEAGDDPELVAQAPFLRRLDVPSCVLFSPATVLGGNSPEAFLRAVLTTIGRPVKAPEGVPVYMFGRTLAGELRVVPPSGGRRRRTRRRMLKKPKTLKKRIR